MTSADWKIAAGGSVAYLRAAEGGQLGGCEGPDCRLGVPAPARAPA